MSVSHWNGEKNRDGEQNNVTTTRQHFRHHLNPTLERVVDVETCDFRKIKHTSSHLKHPKTSLFKKKKKVSPLYFFGYFQVCKENRITVNTDTNHTDSLSTE